MAGLNFSRPRSASTIKSHELCPLSPEEFEKPCPVCLGDKELSFKGKPLTNPEQPGYPCYHCDGTGVVDE